MTSWPAEPETPTVSLALGSGLTGTLATWGMLEALKAEGYFPSSMAAVGWSALWASLWAMGAELHELESLLDSVPTFQWDDEGPFEDWLELTFGPFFTGERLEDWEPRVGIVLTDLTTGGLIEVDRGEAWPAILASLATPPLRAPFESPDGMLADGSLVCPLPVDFARMLGKGAPVIALDLLSAPSKPAVGRVGAWQRGMQLMAKPLLWEQRRMADFTLTPDLLDQEPMDFRGWRLALQAGEKAVTENLGRIKSLASPFSL
ncbi:NTE family protein RssA [compost metagenome]